MPFIELMVCMGDHLPYIGVMKAHRRLNAVLADRHHRCSKQRVHAVPTITPRRGPGACWTALLCLGGRQAV